MVERRKGGGNKMMGEEQGGKKKKKKKKKMMMMMMMMMRNVWKNGRISRVMAGFLCCALISIIILMNVGHERTDGDVVQGPLESTGFGGQSKIEEAKGAAALVERERFSSSLGDGRKGLDDGLRSALWLILNLERRADRWRCTLPKFLNAGITPVKIKATDASIVYAPAVRKDNIMKSPLLNDVQKQKMLRDTGINTGHLATFQSHIDAVKKIRDSNAPIGCIFEDDVTLVAGFKSKVAQMVSELPPAWDLLVLSAYCHSGWPSCAKNKHLQPVSPHLLPIKAFMSGAAYCLNPGSAARIIDGLPCDRNSPFCTVAMDGYLSGLVQEGTLKAFRAKVLPVIIPQDLMKKGLHGIEAVASQDCLSVFDSDIVSWWDPGTFRKGVACVQNQLRGMELDFEIGNRAMTVRPGISESIKTVEGEEMRIFGGGQHLVSWVVSNVDNHVWVSDFFCAILSRDLWRGTSLWFRSSEKARTLGLTLRVSWAAVESRSGVQFSRRVKPAEEFKVFLPNQEVILQVSEDRHSQGADAAGNDAYAGSISTVKIYLGEACG